MKELLPKLKNLCENVLELNNDDVYNILNASTEFYEEAEDFKEFLTSNDVKLQDYTLDTKQKVLNLYGMNLMICTAAQFEEIIDDCSLEYKISQVNDWMEPFFDEDAYYRACHDDKALAKLVLEYDDISEWDEVKYNDEYYIIFR